MALHDVSGAASGLHALRARIRAARVPRAQAWNLRLATWNIRRFGEGKRLPESIEMIAAIIGAFDLVAIVELCEDIGDLHRVLEVLGPRWQAVFSDYLRDVAGNRERIGFVFDTERVSFTGLASTAEGERRLVGGRYIEAVPWWRPPFMASFASGKFDFMLLAAHVRWGGRIAARYAELDALADWVARRSKEPYFGDKDVIVVGDFNVNTLPDPERASALMRRGFQLPAALAHVSTSLGKQKRYDEIMFRDLAGAELTECAGALDFHCGDHQALFPGRRMSAASFTFQVSDHLPLWAELNTRRGD